MLFRVICFFNDTPTTEIYTLSLHDALPIAPFTCSCACQYTDAASTELAVNVSRSLRRALSGVVSPSADRTSEPTRDRKSTRLNSSHAHISYAVFCLKQNNSSS